MNMAGVSNFVRRSRWSQSVILDEGGSNLIEYALTLIIFFLMFFGVVDFGRALYAYHFVSSAARTAARWAAVNGSTCASDGSCPYPNGAGVGDIQNYVKSIAPTPIDTSSTGCGGSGCLSTSATWQAPQWSSAVGCSSPLNAPGCTVAVTVSYKFTFAAPLIHVGALPMSSTAEMVIAH